MSAFLNFIRENHTLAIIEQAIVKKKSTLNLNSFDIRQIPNILYSCRDVLHLYLHKNSISTVSVDITQLINLTTLTLDYNNITELPPEFGNLHSLVSLNISHNPLNVLIAEIGKLESLEVLWCNNIGLKEVPKEICKLEKLDTFGARKNQIEKLPEEFTKLFNLRWLTLESNLIKELPQDLEIMESLVHLNVQHNRVQELPFSLSKCAELMYVLLKDNDISVLPEGFDTNEMISLKFIDLRNNPIAQLQNLREHRIRITDEWPVRASVASVPNDSSRLHVQPAHALAVHGTRLLPVPLDRGRDEDNMDLEEESSSSDESSEDWENSVPSSQLDLSDPSDEEMMDNEVVGVILPELSRFATTGS